MGVWIETGHQLTYSCGAESHPAWVCGLKPMLDWAATGQSPSHPAWVCGLKRYWQWKSDIDRVSHPAWVCGLKLNDKINTTEVSTVTPCVGVWIETENN